MDSGQTVLLACRLARSGFSGERVFRLTLADGAEYVGVAPVGYCLHSDRSPLGVEEPVRGQRIDGLVEGRLVANGGELAQVAMPDGETITIRTELILYKSAPQEKDYVPI